MYFYPPKSHTHLGTITKAEVEEKLSYQRAAWRKTNQCEDYQEIRMPGRKE